MGPRIYCWSRNIESDQRTDDYCILDRNSSASVFNDASLFIELRPIRPIRIRTPNKSSLFVVGEGWVYFKSIQPNGQPLYWRCNAFYAPLLPCSRVSVPAMREIGGRFSFDGDICNARTSRGLAYQVSRNIEDGRYRIPIIRSSQDNQTKPSYSANQSACTGIASTPMALSASTLPVGVTDRIKSTSQCLGSPKWPNSRLKINRSSVKPRAELSTVTNGQSVPPTPCLTGHVAAAPPHVATIPAPASMKPTNDIGLQSSTMKSTMDGRNGSKPAVDIHLSVNLDVLPSALVLAYMFLVLQNVAPLFLYVMMVLLVVNTQQVHSQSPHELLTQCLSALVTCAHNYHTFLHRLHHVLKFSPGQLIGALSSLLKKSLIGLIACLSDCLDRWKLQLNATDSGSIEANGSVASPEHRTGREFDLIHVDRSLHSGQITAVTA